MLIVTTNYLKEILTTRVYNVAVESTLDPPPTLSERLGNRIYFKREDIQSVFSFKLRGAYNKMANLPPKKHVLDLEKKYKLTFVHPFDDPDLIAGQGTIAMEILCQHPGSIHTVFIAIGGAYIKAVHSEIKLLIGVQTTYSDAIARSLKASRRVVLNDVGLFSDSTAVNVKLVGTLAVAGIKAYIERERADRKFLKNETLVTITCCANMNFDCLGFVADVRTFGDKAEALLGDLSRRRRQLLPLLRTDRPAKRDRVQLLHQRCARGACLRRRADCRVRGAAQNRQGFREALFTDLGPRARRTGQGQGPSASPDRRQERTGTERTALPYPYRFEFPERQGALMHFLKSIAPNWNVSLFHYGNQDGDFGRILVGLQLPKKEIKDFRAFLGDLGYRY